MRRSGPSILTRSVISARRETIARASSLRPYSDSTAARPAWVYWLVTIVARSAS